MTVEKPKPKQLLRPITTGADSATNQSQFLEITCNTLKAREKSRVHGAIAFGFASHWLKNWRESFKPITKRSNRNYIITFDSHLKTALSPMSSHQQTDSLIHLLKNLAQVNALYFDLTLRGYFFPTHMVRNTDSVLGKPRLCKQNTKTTVPLDAVPERRTERCSPRFRPGDCFSGSRLKCQSSPRER